MILIILIIIIMTRKNDNNNYEMEKMKIFERKNIDLFFILFDVL